MLCVMWKTLWLVGSIWNLVDTCLHALSTRCILTHALTITHQGFIAKNVRHNPSTRLTPLGHGLSFGQFSLGLWLFMSVFELFLKRAVNFYKNDSIECLSFFYVLDIGKNKLSKLKLILLLLLLFWLLFLKVG